MKTVFFLVKYGRYQEMDGVIDAYNSVDKAKVLIDIKRYGLTLLFP